jgi:NAD(P)-dependent dehydrogenase (short-subunit alcohol dehydrogenase family)
MIQVKKPLALVTGAGRSIGRSIARTLHERGYAIAVTDFDEEGAAVLASELSADGGTARAYRLDVSSTSNIAQVFESVERDMGDIDALVNNAGVYPSQPALDMSEEEWDQVMDTNLKGTFFCSQALARGLVKRGVGGCIVNIASTSAFSARTGVAHYGASKAGVVMLTKSLAQEFGPLGIRVNAVAPGLVEVREGLVSPAYRDQISTVIPSGRIGTPDDIVGVVAFLLTSEASYINGECIVVDGGFLTGRFMQRAAARPA